MEVGLQGLVEVDCSLRIHIATEDDYKGTVGPTTWAAVQYYASDLKDRKVKIAFFSATPQGGGVALMRHALVRCAVSLGVDVKWFLVKRPSRIGYCNANKLIGMSLSHAQGYSVSPKQTTTSCKESLQWTNALRLNTKRP